MLLQVETSTKTTCNSWYNIAMVDTTKKNEEVLLNTAKDFGTFDSICITIGIDGEANILNSDIVGIDDVEDHATVGS